MPKIYRPREVARVVEYLGWQGREGKGDHINYTKPGNPYTITIDMGKREVPRGTFKGTLNKLGITRREFDRIAREIL